MNIWFFQKTLTQHLTLWASISIVLGILCFMPEGDFWGGLAFQFLGWALIELVVAGFGYLSIRSRKAKLSKVEKKEVEPTETSIMVILLQDCTILGVVCMLGGLTLALIMNTGGSFWAGAGIGIILQGAFLFFFSRYHIRKLE